MANNCLVTHYREIVEKDNLEFLGKIIVPVKKKGESESSFNNVFRVNTSTPTTIKALNGGAFAYTDAGVISDPITEDTISSDKIIFVKDDNFSIEISNKYEIGLEFQVTPSIVKPNWDNNGLMPKQYQLYINAGTSLNADNIIKNYPNVTNIRALNTIHGSLEAFSELTGLTSVYLRYSADITGNISYLTKLVSLTSLDLYGSNAVGTLESLASGMVSNGRTSGTLAITGNNIITYQGTPFNTEKTITFNSSLPGGYSVS